MIERTISPLIAKMTFGGNTLCGNAKMVFCEHPQQTLFGGVAMPNISTKKDNWYMAVGSLIFVPLKILTWKDGMCGWELSDLITGGMNIENWKEDSQ